MIYHIVFNCVEPLIYNKDNDIYLNIYRCIEDDIDMNDILIDNPRDMEAKYIVSYEEINSDILEYIDFIPADNKCPNLEYYNKIIKHMCGYHRIIELAGYHKIEYQASNYPYFNNIQFSEGPKMFVRFGNVEITVLDNYLFHKDEMMKELENILENIDSDEYMFRGKKGSDWLSNSEDINYNLRKLITNAGFYLRDTNKASYPTAKSVLEEWCITYLEGILNSRALFNYVSAIPFFYKIQDYIYNIVKRRIYYYNYCETLDDFYNILGGRDIIFVTPHSDKIKELYDSGKIYNLYKDVEIPKYNLKLVNSHISTYPNKPHSSWLETFEVIKRDIDKTFANNRCNLFIASCGCYGIPICSYVFNKYKVDTMYIGHMIHGLFGVLDNSSMGFFGNVEKRIENWVKISVENYEGYKYYKNIDGGRYVLG
jgi:hypothetical protein